MVFQVWFLIYGVNYNCTGFAFNILLSKNLYIFIYKWSME